MGMLLTAEIHPVLAIQISTILLIAGAICAVIAIIGLAMKKGRSKAPDGPAEPSEDMDCAATAQAILEAVGGKGNVTALECQPPHLRFEIRDFTAINEKAIKAAGAAGLVRPSKTSCQVDLGGNAQAVCDELNKLL